MIIYVEENSIRGGVINAVKGVMNETLYAELYSNDALKYLIKDNNHSEVIGQGKWFRSELITKTPSPGNIPILYLKEHPEIYI